MGKASKLAKAKKASTNLKKKVTKDSHKVRTKLRFYRNRTRTTRSCPKTLKSIKSEIKRRNHQGMDVNEILVEPVASDKNLTRMENENTMLWVVGNKTNKPQIKEAFQKKFNVKVRSVRTHHIIGKNKRAYIRLANEKEALNIAGKIGIL